MERTIDRTSYRRSARQREKVSDRWQRREDERIEEEEHETHIKFHFINLFLNQVIVSLLILLGVLTANYFEVNEVTNWIRKNLSGGYRATEIVQKLQEKWGKQNSDLYFLLSSGDSLAMPVSGERMPSGEINHFISGEIVNSGEFISAVEGINQMAEDVKQIQNAYSMISPINGTITSHFGARISDNPIVSSYHTGLDIAADSGTDIKAIGDGKVKLARTYGSYGKCIMIEKGELVILYAHCSAILVKEGDEIKQGDVIGKVGMTGNATGPHLHLEVRFQDRFVDPELVL